MKNFLLLSAFSLLSFLATSQVVTGVYKGKMVSDSLSYSVDFELTLKEKNGELYGYCQRLFLINDVLYYNLVKVKARIKDSVLIVEDEKSVSNNFEEKRRGVKTVYMFNIKDIVDTATVLQGDWATSAARNLYAMPGKLIVNRERNYLATQLYKRLEEKKLTKDMLFEEPTKPLQVIVSTPVKKTELKKEQPLKTATVVTAPKQPSIEPITIPVAKDTTPSTAVVTPNATATNLPKQQTGSILPAPNKTAKDSLHTVVQKTDVVVNQPTLVNKQPAAVDKKQANTKPVEPNNTGSKPITVPNQQTATQKPAIASNQAKQQTVPKPAPTQQQTATNTQTTETKPVTAAVVPPTVEQQSQTETSISAVSQPTKENKLAQPAAAGKPPVINNPTITKRTTEIIDALEITGDSVILSLYDNGEIDGDTVSIFLNNELLLAKVGLRANAYKHTIALKPGEIVQLTLFAENLGAVPPNTGLLVVTTSDQRYQVHFTSTLNKSSSIVIRRKE